MNGDVSGRGARLAAIGVLACCGAVAAYTSGSSTSFQGTVALGTGRRRARDAPAVTSARAARRAAALGRSNNRVQLAPNHHLAYCNVPKAASSTITTYMTGLDAGINTFRGVEEYIQANGGDSHFAMTQYSTFEDAELASQLQPDGEAYKVFTVVRHPGTRLYSTWFDKIHAHRGSDQPDLLYYACNNEEDCSFEQFVEGVTKQISDVDDTKEFINEHVEPQADICNPKKRDFDGVFRLEDGFGEIADTLRDWTGTAFDFQSEDGESGYSHHNSRSKEVYSEFPVSDVEGYESLMPYAIQRKIYEAYRQDFDLFGYRAPVQRDTQLDLCPKIMWTEKLLESEWSGEDSKHLEELEAQGLLNPDLDSGKLPSREELAKPRVPGQQAPDSHNHKSSTTSAEGAREAEPVQQKQQQEVKPVPTAFGGNEFLADDYGEAGGASSSADTDNTDVMRASGSTVPDEATKEVAAKKAFADEAQVQQTSVEQREWEAEVEEARRLHDDKGLSAADAVAKAHSEAIWLKEQKRKLEHAQKMTELDQKWGAAKQKEAKRLVDKEGMSWKDAEKKAQSEAQWMRQHEEEKIMLQEQMTEAESEKRHALAIAASDRKMVEAGAVSSDAAATLSAGDSLADGAVPLEMQRAVGMGEFDEFAGDYSEIDAKIPGLMPDDSSDAVEHAAKEEKAAVQAQWRAKDADVRDVQAEYVKWMRANGKKAPSVSAKKASAAKRADAFHAATKPHSKRTITKAVPDKTRAKGEFERWKKENNVASSDDDESDASRAEAAGTANDFEAPNVLATGLTSPPNAGAESVTVPEIGGNTGLVDPEEVAEAEARAAQKKDLELSSREDAEKLERFEAWKKENEKLDYDEDVVKPVPISEDGRIMTPEQAEEEAKAALEEEQMSDEYMQWVAANLRPRNAQGEAKAEYDRYSAAARASSAASAESSLGSSDDAQKGSAFARDSLGDAVLDLDIFDAPVGHRLDFMRVLDPFLAMRERVQKDHDLLAEELDAIRVATPDVYKRIRENMDEFKAFMTEGLDAHEIESGKDTPLPTADEVFGYLGGMDQHGMR